VAVRNDLIQDFGHLDPAERGHVNRRSFLDADSHWQAMRWRVMTLSMLLVMMMLMEMTMTLMIMVMMMRMKMLTRTVPLAMLTPTDDYPLASFLHCECP
jgi:hypothetical protein